MRATSLSVLFAVLLGGCGGNPARVEHDPWEPLNRGIYAFNDVSDRVLLKPVAKGYEAITPSFVRRGVSNFFDNLDTPRSAINNVLQGKPMRGFSDLTRFLFNSTLGIGGLIDIASAGGLEKYDEDFGQTLAVWGVPAGPYVMLPFRGPSTLRDTFAMPVDLLADPLVRHDETSVRDPLIVMRIIDLRTRLFSVDRLLEDSPDRYITIRESFLQNRNYVIHDGDPPIDDDFYDDFDDDFDDDLDDNIDIAEPEDGDEDAGGGR